MSIKVRLAGNKRVNAEINGYTIHTDQPVSEGGDGTAPTPFELFLASLGTCAGIYVQGYCMSRQLDYEGIEIEEIMGYDSTTGKINKIRLDIKVPEGFPEKHIPALANAANLCKVKKTIADPPEFEIVSGYSRN